MTKKRQDFDKIQEVAAHMDNVFRRLSSFFPHTEDYNHKTSQPIAVPVLPSLPPRNKAIERGVSARKLTGDHDVSVAGDSYFNGGLSGRSCPKCLGLRYFPKKLSTGYVLHPRCIATCTLNG